MGSPAEGIEKMVPSRENRIRLEGESMPMRKMAHSALFDENTCWLRVV
jgi:hypothetical protein